LRHTAWTFNLVRSVKFFHHYLYECKFLIQNHISLKWLLSFKELEGQLARGTTWMERLQQYNFEVDYHKGLSHKNADGLSRRPCVSDQYCYCTNVELKAAAKQESYVRRILRKTPAKIGVRSKWKIVLLYFFIFIKKRSRRGR